METEKKIEQEPKERPWVLNLIGLLFFLALAVLSYYHIQHKEEEGGVIILNKLLALPYAIGGKWGVVGFWLIFVAYNLIKGTITLVKNR